MKKTRHQKAYFCFIFAIALLVFEFTTTSLALANDTARQNEISSFWQTLMKQLNKTDIAQLDKTASKNQGGSRQPDIVSIALIFDQGILRPRSDKDHTLEPNHYMTLLFEKNFLERSWSIVAFDNQNFNRKAFSYCNGIEIIYAYDDAFYYGQIARSAMAYRDGVLIARADATRRIETTSPSQIEVKEVHYDKNNNGVYAGMLTISLARMGKIIRESPTFGKKTSQVFNGWATSNL